MKKLISLLCAALLLFTVTTSALANSSIGALQPQVVPEKEEETASPKGELVTEEKATVKEQWNQAVADVVTEQNEENGEQTEEENTVTLKDVVDQLVDLPSNESVSVSENTLQMKNNTGTTKTVINMNGLNIVSDFSSVSDSDGTNETYDNDGKNISTTITQTYEELIGADTKNAQILVMNPVTGELALVDVQPEDVNSDTGELNIELPFLGVYALVLDEEEAGEDGEKESKIWSVQVDPIAVAEDTWDDTVADVIVAQNNPEEEIGLQDVLVTLADLPVNGSASVTESQLTVTDSETGESISLDLTNADFASGFSEVYITDDTEVKYDLNGEAVSVDLNLAFPQLQNRDASEFVILLINTETGEMAIITLSAENFNPETGEVLVSFPFLGVFALIEK